MTVLTRRERLELILTYYLLWKIKKEPRVVRRVIRYAQPITKVEGLNQAQADARYVNVTGDTMTGNLNIDTHDITGAGDPNFIGFTNTTKRLLLGGYDGTTVRGAWFEVFGNATTVGVFYKGCAEFGLDSTNLAAPWFRIQRYRTGGSDTLLKVVGTYTGYSRVELNTTNQSYYLQVEDSAFNGFGIYQGAPATAGWVVKWLTDYTMEPQGDITMLDQKMMTFGTYTDAQRPAAGTAGRWIFNTDDGMPNYDDGTNWRDINGNIT